MSDAKYVLDAYALLALLGDEPGADTVARILVERQGAGGILMSMINLGEAYYILLRQKGRTAAEDLAREAFVDEALTLVDLSWERIKRAAEIKSKGGVSYADSFALALAAEANAPVVTGDPEIRGPASAPGIAVTWIGAE